MKEEKIWKKTEASCSENEANKQDDIVQCRLLNEEDAEKEKQLNHCLENSKTKVNKNGKLSFLENIAMNLDLDLVRDSRYTAIVLGR